MAQRIKITGFGARQETVNRIFSDDPTNPDAVEMSWYKDKIGESYEVRKIGNTVYFLSDQSVSIYPTVDKKDAVLLE